MEKIVEAIERKFDGKVTQMSYLPPLTIDEIDEMVSVIDEAEPLTLEDFE